MQAICAQEQEKSERLFSDNENVRPGTFFFFFFFNGMRSFCVTQSFFASAYMGGFGLIWTVECLRSAGEGVIDTSGLEDHIFQGGFEEM